MSIDGTLHLRRQSRSTLLGVGTLACPACDAPVGLPGGRAAPASPLGCPFCDHDAPVRDFLSLGEPTRPTRVRVRVLGADALF